MKKNNALKQSKMLITIILVLVISTYSCKKDEHKSFDVVAKSALSVKINPTAVKGLSFSEYRFVDSLLKLSLHQKAIAALNTYALEKGIFSAGLPKINRLMSDNTFTEDYSLPGFYYGMVEVSGFGFYGWGGPAGYPAGYETDYSTSISVGSQAVYPELPYFKARVEYAGYLAGRNLNVNVVVPYKYALTFPNQFSARYKFEKDLNVAPRIEISGSIGQITHLENDFLINNSTSGIATATIWITDQEIRSALVDDDGKTEFTSSANLMEGLQIGQTNSRGFKITRKFLSQSHFRYSSEYTFYGQDTGFAGSLATYQNNRNHGVYMNFNSPVVGAANERFIYEGIISQ
ncbi:hypothetical protein [Pedobacter jeongneungensis]|uniref:hypothetical protein n=1 Tax=Pedobacter jeongneungensis TaxID=947309 RepID=UPI000469C9DE|nr:hypothetical protein [Pedobacter jeongneungensis]